MKKYALFVAVVVMALCFFAGTQRPVTLFLVGDSTMADKSELDISPERGWGQLFPTYLKTDGSILVRNHAKNGRSTKSFINEGRWEVVMSQIQKGDYVIIQFGHNDEKKNDSTRYTDLTQYRTNLLRMVNDVKSKHATPILATPCCRRYFKADGTFRSGHHGGYPEAVRQVALYAGVNLIDAEKFTEEWLKNEGKDNSKKYFMHVAKGEAKKFPDGKKDNTHFREAGALKVGKMIAEDIVRQKIKGLSDYIDPNATTTIYTTPDPLVK